ncbi:N/A [soil metagenome]
MRILMLSQFFTPITGGREAMVEALSLALARVGHDVAVVTSPSHGTASSETYRDIQIRRLGGTLQRFTPLFEDTARRHLAPAPDPELVIGLRRLIERERPDVIHAHDWMVHSLWPLSRSRIPVCLTLHDYGLSCANKRFMHFGIQCSGPDLRKCVSCASQYYGVAKGVPTALALRAMAPAIIRTVDHYLPVSTSVATAERLAERGLQYDVVPNFLAESVRSARHHDVSEEVARQLPSKDFVMFAGDATYDKGVDVLLHAHRALGGKYPLVIFGRPFSPRLDPPPHNVYVMGTHSHREVLAAWRRASIAVVPSVWAEPFGLVALEAMAMGRPVVASATGGLVDIVVQDRTGLLVPPGDVDALAGAIVRLMEDPVLRSEMGRAAQERSETFDETASASRHEQIYDEMRQRYAVD